MPSSSALPFHLTRSSQVIAAGEIRQTTERIDGLLRIAGERLVVQWRSARRTQLYGTEIRADQELDPVREVEVPLAALAGAEVRGERWYRWGPARIVLSAADLRAFEGVAGAAGLKLDHPATLELSLRRADRLAAREFAADVNLALAERALRKAESPPERQLDLP